MHDPSTASSFRQPPVHHIREVPAPKADDKPAAASAVAWGGGEVPADDPNAQAKAVRDATTGLTKYFVKKATQGVNANQMYNPTGLLFNAAAVARDRYEWKPVSQAAYDHYIRFLTTKNPLFLKHAERA